MESLAKKVWLIDSDMVFVGCLSFYCKQIRHLKCKTFYNLFEVIPMLETELPDLIVLEIMLDGPNGFTLLNELASYPDTAKIPIIIVTSLNINCDKLPALNVWKIFRKETMVPDEFLDAVRVCLKSSSERIPS